MLKQMLGELNAQDWVEGSAVIRRDGVLMACNLPKGDKVKENCATMSATIVGAAKSITTKCSKGFPKRIIIQAKNGDIIISEAGNKALLVCFTSTPYEPVLMLDYLENMAHSVGELF